MLGPNSSESHELGVVLGLYIHQQGLYSTIAYSAPGSYQLLFKVLLGSSSLLSLSMTTLRYLPRLNSLASS